MNKKSFRPILVVLMVLMPVCMLLSIAARVRVNNKTDLEPTPVPTLEGRVAPNPTVIWNEERATGERALTPTEPGQSEDITGIVTPNVSKLDPAKIVGEYMPNPDTTGLEVLDQNSLGDTSKITYLKGLSQNGSVIEIINGATFVNGVLLVNKTFRLPRSYVPKSTHDPVAGKQHSFEGIVDYAWDAWISMKEDAEEDGLELKISSAYRSFDSQEFLFETYVDTDGLDAADTYSARAGHSEHQTGLTFDLNVVSDDFTDTPEGIWVNENCYKYGYIIRFPVGKEEYTGYKYESWHLRYVGRELAELLYNDGDWISMEEFFGLTSQYNYKYAIKTPTPTPTVTEAPEDDEPDGEGDGELEGDGESEGGIGGDSESDGNTGSDGGADSDLEGNSENSTFPTIMEQP